MPDSGISWWKSRPVQIVSLILIAQAALFYSSSRGEAVPLRQPLAGFPREFANWSLSQEGVVDEKTNAILRADDTLTRYYTDAKQENGASLFIAYFKSQRQGQAPHSPKHCLPGAGWAPVSTGFTTLSVDGRPAPITVNRFVLQKGNDRAVVLYWYQSNQRVVASEYEAKIFLVLDALRYHRTDTALVRVIVPIKDSEQQATEQGVKFIQGFFPRLGEFLPS